MKFSEAMKALEEGKKVRYVFWDDEDYLYVNKFGDVERYSGYSFCIAHAIHDDWEIYEEKPEPHYQWRFIDQGGRWYVSNYLLTEEQAARGGVFPEEYEIHAGPFYPGGKDD